MHAASSKRENISQEGWKYHVPCLGADILNGWPILTDYFFGFCFKRYSEVYPNKHFLNNYLPSRELLCRFSTSASVCKNKVSATASGGGLAKPLTLLRLFPYLWVKEMRVGALWDPFWYPSFMPHLGTQGNCVKKWQGNEVFFKKKYMDSSIWCW